MEQAGIFVGEEKVKFNGGLFEKLDELLQEKGIYMAARPGRKEIAGGWEADLKVGDYTAYIHLNTVSLPCKLDAVVIDNLLFYDDDRTIAMKYQQFTRAGLVSMVMEQNREGKEDQPYVMLDELARELEAAKGNVPEGIEVIKKGKGLILANTSRPEDHMNYLRKFVDYIVEQMKQPAAK